MLCNSMTGRHMHKEPCNYGDYFHPGQRARVELSLKCGSVFRDGAVVTAIADDSIALRLSRDSMPEGALLHPEAPLLIRVGGSGSGYSCRATVLHERPGQELRATLVDPVVPEDLRAFFRVATELPVTLFNVTADASEENGQEQQREQLPRVVDISGGGIRTETSIPMRVGDTVYGLFQLPFIEPKAIPVVGQVVHSDIYERAGKAVVSAGLKFVHIDERDRDAVVRFVCIEEMRQIRRSRRPIGSLYDH